jgi:hypothetical protein
MPALLLILPSLTALGGRLGVRAYHKAPHHVDLQSGPKLLVGQLRNVTEITEPAAAWPYKSSQDESEAALGLL